MNRNKQIKPDDGREESITPRRSRSKPQRRFSQTHLAFALVILIVLVFPAAYFLTRPHYVKTPNIEWEKISSARKTLKNEGLNLSIKGHFYSESVPKGYVISQIPNAGEKIKQGSSVVVSVSKGFVSVTVPDLIGKEFKDLGFTLESASLRLGQIHEDTSSGLSSNVVIRQSPSAGASASLGSAVNVWLGPQQYIVPSVEGMKMERAIVILQKSAFDYKVISKIDSHFPQGTVISQLPEAGSPVSLNSTVYLVVSGPISQKRDNYQKPIRKVVCIDPGHQARGSNSAEPVGPGSGTTKPEVASGAAGVVTKTPEYEINLQIATKLKSLLEKSGVRVVMTRTSSEVNISNVERAQIASRAKADLFVRIHCDSSEDRSYHGISTLYPAKNAWTSPFFDKSLKAAELIQKSIIREVGSGNLGIVPRNDLTGFNWSKVPVVLVESGFLSNPFEDKELNDPTYQLKLARGVSRGILIYLRT